MKREIKNKRRDNSQRDGLIKIIPVILKKNTKKVIVTQTCKNRWLVSKNKR